MQALILIINTTIQNLIKYLLLHNDIIEFY